MYRPPIPPLGCLFSFFLCRPPPFCKILQRWGRVCPRPSPSLACPSYLFIYTVKKIPVWWRCAALPSLPGCLFSFFLSFTIHATAASSWSASRHCCPPPSSELGAPPLTDAALAEALRRPRPNVSWTGSPPEFSQGCRGVPTPRSVAAGELLHKQPQHRYVWNEHGGVQCDCVVRWE